MSINLIVAIGKFGEIGKDNKLLWKQKADMQMFKKLTQNSVVIMGRNTWESIPEKFRPLPNRVNIVVSTTMNPLMGIHVAQSVASAILMAASLRDNDTVGDDVFFIGGKRIYEDALMYIDNAIVTHIHESFRDADAYFEQATEFGENFPDENITLLAHGKADEDNEYDYRIVKYSN